MSSLSKMSMISRHPRFFVLSINPDKCVVFPSLPDTSARSWAAASAGGTPSGGQHATIMLTSFHPALVSNVGPDSEAVTFWLVFLVVVLFALLGGVFFFYYGELYRLFPWWGPISRFDAPASDGTKLRQEVFATVTAREREEVIIEGARLFVRPSLFMSVVCSLGLCGLSVRLYVCCLVCPFFFFVQHFRRYVTSRFRSDAKTKRESADLRRGGVYSRE